jgi:hypothetical protein
VPGSAVNGPAAATRVGAYVRVSAPPAIASPSGMSAAMLRSVNESLRDDLARLRVLADSVRTDPDRAGDLRGLRGL